MTNKQIVLLISLFFILLNNLHAQSAPEVSVNNENVDKKEKINDNKTENDNNYEECLSCQ